MMEVNFDGIVGPTHSYSGLAFGNIASLKHKSLPSNPKLAALQGIEKMYALYKMGVKQGVLPPHERPSMKFLHRVGFENLKQATPELLSVACSAAAMWAANSATVSPSSDSSDHKVHITPANLSSYLHRSLEAETTATILKKIFPFCVHHEPLPATPQLNDEGSANHTRFQGGVQLFVYGKGDTKKYPARQTLEASKAIARLHKLDPQLTIFAQQNSEAIDAGVFHNDVISVGFENIFFYHERAFAHTEQLLQELRAKVPNLIEIRVNEHDISLEQAVETYLFNSQIVRDQKGRIVLIAPEECKSLTIPFETVHYFNLKESMQNGGGPACLRLRVPLTPEELSQVHPQALMSENLYRDLKKWVNAHYRDRLTSADLADPKLLHESRAALDSLTNLLQLGPIYDFQR